MKSLVVSLFISSLALAYFATGGLPATPPLVKDVDRDVDSAGGGDDDEPDEEQTERMVQIQGKWYKYRPDNRYVIDGVATLHIPKKIEEKKIALAPAATAPRAQREQHAKSQKLLEMAGANPAKVYSPEGFQQLKEGLDAAKKSADDRNRALEDLTTNY